VEPGAPTIGLPVGGGSADGNAYHVVRRRRSFGHAQCRGGAGGPWLDGEKAANGVAAMERLPELCADVDVMVVDIRLGQGPTGWDVARYARSVSTQIPIAYITGDEMLAGASRQGVEGSVILRKPVTEGQLLAALGSLIAAHD